MPLFNKNSDESNDDMSMLTNCEVNELIKGWLFENQSLEEVKQCLSLIDNENDNEKRSGYVTTTYVGLGYQILTDKCKTFTSEMLEKVDNDDEIINWIQIFYGNETKDFKEKLLNLFEGAPFFEVMEICFELNQTKVENFYNQLSRNFRSVFEKTSLLNGFIGIFCSLLKCKKLAVSPKYCETMKKLCTHLFGDRTIINLSVNSNNTHREHNKLANLVDAFILNPDDENPLITKLIEKLFEPIKFETYYEDGDRVLEVNGRNIIWNEISNQFYEKYDESSFDQIRLAAFQQITLDENLNFPGKNLSLITKELNCPVPITCNLSGEDAFQDPSLIVSAKNGGSIGENGEDGKDGKAGGSSGNFLICAEKIVNEQNLNVVLHGGNGAKGQNGGNGAAGKNGRGENFNERFGPAAIVHRTAISIVIPLSGVPIASSLNNALTREPMSNGMTHVYSISRHYLATHSLSLIEGTKGLPGGKGGKNGNGGEGGRKGACTIINKSDELITLTNVSSENGFYGKPGKPGVNGENGKDGWDIGLMHNTFKFFEYGKNHNEKLDIVYTDKYENDTFYVKQLYTGEGSMCYARITTKPCENKVLKDSEKFTELKDENERKGEALAQKTNSININAVENKFENICQSESSIEANEENEIEEEIEKHANRVADNFGLSNEIIYVPKKRHVVPSLSPDTLNAAVANKEETWDKIWKAVATDDELKRLQNACSKKNKEKLKHKLLLARLRLSDEQSILDSQNAEKTPEKMAKFLQQKYRNCFPFLSPASNVNVGVVDACVGSLMENPNYSGILEEAVYSIMSKRLTPPVYFKYLELLNEFEKIQIDDKSISESKLEIETIFNLLSDTSEIRATLDAKVTDVITRMVVEKSVLDNINEKLDLLISDGEIKESKKNFSWAFRNENSKLLYFYLKIHKAVVANQVLAESLKLAEKVRLNEVQLEKYSKLFDDDTSILKWLEISNKEEHVKHLIEDTILEYRTKCAAARLLISWKTKVNLRIYNDGQLIEDHMPGISGNIGHLEICATTGKFTLLFLNMERIKLEMKRTNAVELFQQKLEEVEQELNCSHLLPHESLIISRWCSGCEKGKREELKLNELGILKLLLDKLFSFISDQSLAKDGCVEMQNQIEILCTDFPDIGIATVCAMLNIFEVDGCHIDNKTFKYLIDTIFVSSFNYSVQDKHLFPYILFCSEQSAWIDEFFIINAENLLMTSIPQKSELLKDLAEFDDENLKFLLTEKLQNEKINSDELAQIIQSLKCFDDIYPQLTDISLSKWLAIIKDNQIYSSLHSTHFSFLNEKQRNLAVFWCGKLSPYYDNEEILKTFAVLGQGLATSKEDEKTLSQFVQRLCNNEIVSGEIGIKPSPSKLFAHIFSPISDEFGIIVEQKDKEMAHELLNSATKHLDAAAYKHESWVKILSKCNIPASPTLESTCELLKSNPSTATAVKECVKMLLKHQHSSASKYMNSFKKVFSEFSFEDFDYFLLEIVAKIIKKLRGFKLRLNQRAAALCAIKSNFGVLQQLATGEGKSLIVTAVSIIYVLKGKHVNIVTSSPTLAKRDTECVVPIGCLDIYRIFGINASHICIENALIRAERYAKNEIIYGDLTSFQRDYLLDNFYSMNIIGNRRPDIVIIDEVDSMLLGQLSNVLYLSHEIPDLEMLQPLFVKIWHIVNCDGDLNEETVFEAIFRLIFPTFLLHSFAEMLGITEDEAITFKLMLISKQIIDKDTGELLLLNRNKLLEILKTIQAIPESTKTRFIFSYDRIISEDRLNIPQHLQSFVKFHLKEFIKNAKLALSMEEGVEYEVDIVRSDVATTYYPKIIIIDQDTGADLPTTQWSNALHQFLQLKHGVRLTPISLKAVYISNVSYLKMFGKIFGFSGTLGTDAERKQLSDIYKLECITLPSSLPKQFYEEPSIVATSENDETNSHVNEIFNAICNKLESDRSVLVICESIKQVTELSRRVKSLANQILPISKQKPFNDALLYRRDHDKFPYGDGTSKLEPGKIIWATNLAGRGTDILLSNELKSNGGLHVIVAFLPQNLRVEEQAFGRAARSGDEGTAQLIVYTPKVKSDIFQLKLKRNAQSIQKIQQMTKYYNDTLLIDENCFEAFSQKFKKIADKMNPQKFSCEELKLASRDLLDQWAFKLDEIKYTGLSGKYRIETSQNFCKKLLNNGKMSLTQPLNKLKYGIVKASQKEYNQAKNLFENINQNFAFYSPESKYYLAYIYVKQNRNITEAKHYLKIEKLLEEARKGFERRLLNYYSDRAIVENYKKCDKVFFVNDAFSQQQLELAQLMNLFIESIDTLFGGRIDRRDFMIDFITEESSHLFYQFFKSSENFHSCPILKTQVAEDYDLSKLEEYCKKCGIPVNEMRENLGKFKTQPHFNECDFVEALKPPTLEKFWNELLSKDLIINEKHRLFANSSKFLSLNPKLVELIQRFAIEKKPLSEELNIYQHSFVMKENWIELNKADFDMEVREECINVLESIGVLCSTRLAKFVPKTEEEILALSFENFGVLKINDFFLYGLSTTEAENILVASVRSNILKRLSNGYGITGLTSTILFDNEAFKKLKLPQCYESIISSVFKHKLAFSLTFYGLQKTLSASQQQLGIELPTLKECPLIFDLIDLGILKKTNVDFKAFNENCKTTFMPKKFYNYLTDNQSSENIKKAAVDVVQTCEANLMPKDEKVQKVENYKEITNDATLQELENIFVQRASAPQRFKTLDAKLINLYDKLAECNLIELRISTLMTRNGATHLICLTEQKWSWKTIGKLSCVTTAAAVQLAIGGVILVYSSGVGMPVANFFISEGISDIIYVLKGACTGYADNYKQHKMMSMLASGMLCGVGAYFARGSQFNSVAHGLFGTGFTSGGVNNAALKGGKLIAEAGATTVAQHVSKEIGKRIGSTLLNLAIFTALQQGLKLVIDAVITETRKKIISNVDTAFNQLESLRDLLKEVFDKFGINKSKELIIECGNKVLFGRANNWLNEICDFIFVKYRHLFINFGQGILKGMKTNGNPAPEMIKRIMNAVPGIIIATQVSQLFFTLRGKAERIMIDIEDTIRNEFEAKKKSINENQKLSINVSDKPDDLPNELVKEEQTRSLIEKWHMHIAEIIEKTLEARIAMPLLALATSAIQKQLESMVSKQYSNYMERRDKEEIEKCKKDFEAAKASQDKGEYQKARKDYIQKLAKLQKCTRSPEVYAQIIIEGAEIDEISVSAVANVIQKELNLSVSIQIKTEDGGTFTHSVKNESDQVQLVLIELTQPSETNKETFYDQIIHHIPQLAERFIDNQGFRNLLAAVIAEDSFFKQHIKNGWHSIAIEKRLIKYQKMRDSEIIKLNDISCNYGKNDFLKMVGMLQKIPDEITKIYTNYSNYKRKADEQMQQVKMIIDELKTYGYTDLVLDVHNIQSKIKQVLVMAPLILKQLIEQHNTTVGQKKISENEDLNNVLRNQFEEENRIAKLFMQFGDYEAAKKINPNIQDDEFTIVKAVNVWQNTYSSDGILRKMRDVYNSKKFDDQKNIKLTALEGLCSKVAKTLRSSQTICELRAVAVGIVPSEKETICFSLKNNGDKRLDQKQKSDLINDVIKKNNAELKANKIKKIKMVEQCSDNSQQESEYFISLFLIAYERNISKTSTSLLNTVVFLDEQQCSLCSSLTTKSLVLEINNYTVKNAAEKPVQ